MDAAFDVLTAVKEHWIIASLMLVTVLAYWHYVVNFTALKKLGIPGPTPLPLIGNSMTFIWNSKTLHDFFCEAGRKFGRIYGLYYLKEPMIIVAEPDIIRQVMVKEFDKFHDRPVSLTFYKYIFFRTAYLDYQCFDLIIYMVLHLPGIVKI